MNFKPGDKVSFLNEKRNGIVTRLLGKKMIMVAIEEGFEIPVQENELVHAVYSPEPEIVKTDSKTQDIISVPEAFPERLDLFNPANSKLRQGLYLSFIPENEKAVTSGKLYVYLLNHTIFDILFSYALPFKEEYICKDFDRIDSETALMLKTIDSTELEEWKGFYIQAIYFIKDSTQHVPPLQNKIKIHPVKFYKEENFRYIDLLCKKAFTESLDIEKDTKPENWESEQWENSKVGRSTKLKIVGHIKHLQEKEPFPKKYQVTSDSAEVDLHIEELTDDYAGKSNHELLQLQLNHFNNLLDKAITAKLRKIIFIHGVGNGILKKAILDKIQNDYPYLQTRDASMSKYGTGATEVLIFNEK